MTCEDALVQLLEADVAGLHAEAPTALELHVRGCERCGPVAATLVRETERLAHALRSQPVILHATPRRAQRPVRVLVPAMVLAASVACVLWIRREAPAAATTPNASPVGSSVVQAASNAGSPSAQTPPPARTPAAAPAMPSAETQSRGARVPVPPPAAVVAVAVEAVPAQPVGFAREEHAAEFQIDPEPGTRATVMRGRHPNVTVVWLSKTTAQ